MGNAATPSLLHPQVLAAMLGALVTGLLALVALWATARNAREAKRYELETARTEKLRERRLHRLEELFYFTSKWAEGVREINLLHQAVLDGSISREAALAQISRRGYDRDLDPSRYSQLVASFAPDLLVTVEELMDAHDRFEIRARAWEASDSEHLAHLVEQGRTLWSDGLRPITLRLGEAIRAAV